MYTHMQTDEMSLHLQLTGHAQETPAVVGQFHKLVEGLSDAKSTADMVPWCWKLQDR